MRTLTTGAVALLIAAIVGVLALTAASAQEPSYPATPEGLRQAQLAFIAEVDRADADRDDKDDTDGRIIIDGTGGPDTLQRALAWLDWQNGREARGESTLEALGDVRVAKAALDQTERACIAAFVVCVWDTPDPVVADDVEVQVRVVRKSVSEWSVNIRELGSRGGVTDGEAMTVEPTADERAIAETGHTLRNGTRVVVVVDLKRDKRLEVGILLDKNGNGRVDRTETLRLPDQRFAPANARFERPLLSSRVDIPYTATEWWLAEDGS